MMEGFVAQFPAIAIVVLSVALGALAWYLRADRERLFSEIAQLRATVNNMRDDFGLQIQRLRIDVHEAMLDHGERISRLEGLVAYHLKHNGESSL